MAKLLVLDVKEKVVYQKECNDLQDYYDALNCDCFDIAHIRIGEKYFDCFVDDEGLFKEDIIPSVISKEQKVLLVGNVIFANHNSEGETLSLTDKDIEIIENNMFFGIDSEHRFLIGVLGSY